MPGIDVSSENFVLASLSLARVSSRAITTSRGSPREIRPWPRWIVYIRVATHTRKRTLTGVDTPRDIPRYSRAPVSPASNLHASSHAANRHRRRYFSYYYKACTLATLACASPSTVRRVVYKRYKFYRNRGSRSRSSLFPDPPHFARRGVREIMPSRGRLTNS